MTVVGMRAAPGRRRWLRADDRPPGARSPAEAAVMPVAVVGAAAAAGLVVGMLDSIILPAAAVVVAAVAVALRAPRDLALAVLLGLPLLGFLRRISGSYALPLDPLVMAGPAAGVTCLLALRLRQGARVRTPLATAVSAMLAVGVLQVFNPGQGGVTAGLIGAVLFVGPLVWFFVGHRIGDEPALALMLPVLKVLALATAAYGVKQLLWGFSGFEQAWIESRRADYAALDISGFIRPFSTFTSGAEYSYFLALGAALFATGAGALKAVGRWGCVLALLLTAFFAGSRTAFVAAVLGVVFVVLVRRVRSVSKVLVACVVVAVLGLLSLRLVPLSEDDSTAAAIRNRTIVGLVRPFDDRASTLGLHLNAFRHGVAEGLRTPLGRGAATVNLAGAKLGAGSVSAEHDVANVLLAYGWAGGVVLVLTLFRGYRVVRACVRQRRIALFGPVAFVLATFGVWFSGELYAVTPLLWFFVGAIDRLAAEGAAAAGVERGTAAAVPSTAGAGA